MLIMKIKHTLLLILTSILAIQSSLSTCRGVYEDIEVAEEEIDMRVEQQEMYPVPAQNVDQPAELLPESLVNFIIQNMDSESRDLMRIIEQNRNIVALLTGTEGVGKKALGKAIAQHLGKSLYHLDLASIPQDSYVAAITEMIEHAIQTNESCVILIDGIDLLVINHDNYTDDAPAYTLSAWIDETEDKPIAVIGTTTKKCYSIADVLTSRCDTVISMDLPTLEQRENILRYYLSQAGQAVSDETITEAARITKNFSPRNLRNVIESALEKSLQMFITQDKLLQECNSYRQQFYPSWWSKIKNWIGANPYKAIGYSSIIAASLIFISRKFVKLITGNI
jgi:SpoVK/Ycf46/Vps4 family AAA+-type ATPase